MPELLYKAHPSVWRSHPLGTLIAWLLIGAGGYLVATGWVPYLSILLAQVPLPRELDLHLVVRVLGIMLVAAGLLRLLTWWLGSRFERLEVFTNQVVWTHGLLSRVYTEINMGSIRTTRVSQSLLQRILGAGDLVIFTTGDHPELAVRGLPRPHEIREHIKRHSAAEA